MNSTPASVTTAIGNISNGTVAGLVPGAALINNVVATTAALTAYAKATATTNPTFDTTKDGNVDVTEAGAAATAAAGIRNGVDIKTTAVLTTDLSTAAAAAAASKAVVTATTGGTAALAAYDTALAAQKALVGTTAATATKTALQVASDAADTGAAAALASLDSAITTAAQTTYAKLNIAFGGTVLAPTITNAADLKVALNSATSTAKTAMLTELQKVTTYGQAAIDTVAKQAAFAKAAGDVTTAHNAGVLATDGYITKADAVDTATTVLTKAQVADVAVAAAKVVVDQYASLTNAQTIAKAALSTFASANTDKVTLADASTALNGDILAASAKSDVFYFGSKLDAAKDLSIGTSTTTFGAGDSIVLGSSYTFNAGALSTGNNNALEIFLVKGSTGTQVVIETDAFGSANNVVDASGNITSSPSATVINLVGVTADHLSVANGVVSYV